jgi:hypothetical protein
MQMPKIFQRRPKQNLPTETGVQLHRETDQTLALGTLWRQSEQERDPIDRETLLQQSLTAWQVNPLARRIVELTTQYVVGAGINMHCDHAATMAFLQACWNHSLNHMDTRILDWCDELTRSGNLFILLTTDAAGMSYFRAVPAAQIEHIETAGNDLDQPRFYHRKHSHEDIDPTPYPAYDARSDQRSATGSYPPVLCHFTINRPIGALWGESDLAPLLRWVSRYASWLEDRARLNRYRNAFLYVVKGRFLSEADRLSRQRALNAHPPTPGSILVADESEQWEIIAPQLAASDASLDGLALKKMIAAGAGVPLHFLAEPESATRTTAEASGGPAFRHYQQRQRLFLWIVQSVLQAAVRRRAMVDERIDPSVTIEMRGPDVSPRDNLALSQAAQHALESFLPLYQQELITHEELIRMVYRFAGE